MRKTKLQVLMALVLSLVLALFLTACGGGGDEPADGSGGSGSAVNEPSGGDADAGDPEVPQPEPASAIASGEWEGYAGKVSLSIVGAEIFTDVNDGDALRVYYDFHNDGSNIFTTHAGDELDRPVYLQDGAELGYTFAYEDVPEYGGDGLSVRPGHAVRFVEEYELVSAEGAVTVEQYSYSSDELVLSHEFDLANLPGAPAEALKKQTVSDPQWLAGWPSEGAYHDDYYVAITGHEIVDGREGGSVLRVFMDFTNNSDEETSLSYELYWNRGFQDGVEIMQGIPADSREEDGNYMIDVVPGGTVSAAYCYALNGSSPVEVELLDPWADGVRSDEADGGIGVVIDVA